MRVFSDSIAKRFTEYCRLTRKGYKLYGRPLLVLVERCASLDVQSSGPMDERRGPLPASK